MTKSSLMRGLPVAVLAAVCAGGVAAGPVHAEGGSGKFKEAAQAAFTEADSDASGELSAAEFAKFHDVLRSKMASMRFAKLDTDGSGGLSQAELEAGRPHGRRHHKCS
jgi:hypothetical protein